MRVFFTRERELRIRRRRRKRRKKEGIFSNEKTLPICLGECDDIRKMLKKNHTCKVPSKAANRTYDMHS